MDEVKVANMKFTELQNYAKELAINNFGKYTGIPSRELIIEKIRAHFEAKEEEEEAPKRSAASGKTPKKQLAKDVIQSVRFSPPAPARHSKRQNVPASATPSKLAKSKVDERLYEALADSAVDGNREKKTKKVSKKSTHSVGSSANGSGKRSKKSKKPKTEEAEEEENKKEEQPQQETLPEAAASKVSRRKHAVASYKEIDAKSKLRNANGITAVVVATSKTKSKKENNAEAKEPESQRESRVVSDEEKKTKSRGKKKKRTEQVCAF